ncbi:MAG: thioredoxin family protein [Arenicellales bacterium]|nr:thioredoxin family protein [Arenicellales bacterium]
MNKHTVVSRDEWITARKALLEKEKEFTRLRDQLSDKRRALPWVKVEKEYVFQGPSGKESLSDLFEGRTQLMIYHFMFHPDWEDACKSCSFWADNYNGMIVHLNHRDVSFVVVSRAPIEKLNAFKQRMGWDFKWVSSFDSDFNYDFNVSFTPEEMEKGQMAYNYTVMQFPAPEAPGLSVFYKDEDGSIFHTYSCYARGLDILNGTYNHLDMTPKGRDEKNLSYTMEWVRLKDRY